MNAAVVAVKGRLPGRSTKTPRLRRSRGLRSVIHRRIRRRWATLQGEARSTSFGRRRRPRSVEIESDRASNLKRGAAAMLSHSRAARSSSSESERSGKARVVEFLTRRVERLLDESTLRSRLLSGLTMAAALARRPADQVRTRFSGVREFPGNCRETAVTAVGGPVASFGVLLVAHRRSRNVPMADEERLGRPYPVRVPTQRR